MSEDQVPPNSDPEHNVPYESLWRVLRIPNSGFGVALGCAGTSVLWRRAAVTRFTSDVGTAPNCVFWIMGIIALSLTSLLYLVKMIHPSYRWMVLREWRHPLRRYLFNGPHLAILMLNLGTPEHMASKAGHRASFVLCLIVQIGLSLRFYRAWMFSKSQADVGHAGPLFLLSTVGWFFLTLLAQSEDLATDWEFDFAPMLFGIGVFAYSLALAGIFLHFHTDPSMVANPANFLILAPSSVASIGLAGLTGDFGQGSRAILGFVMLMLMLLLATGPSIIQKPTVYGHYLPFVFPTAAMANATILYAETMGTNPAKAVAWILIGFQSMVVSLVLLREFVHLAQVFCGAEPFTDPLFDQVLDGLGPKSEFGTSLERVPKDLEAMEAKPHGATIVPLELSLSPIIPLSSLRNDLRDVPC